MSTATSPASERFVRDPGAVVALARELAPALASGASDPSHREAALIQSEIGRLAGVPGPVLLAELEAALCAPDAAATLDALADFGALVLLLPEVAALIGFHRSSPLPHKDLWAHTLTVLGRAPPEPDLRWVALCHDIGKIATRAVAPDGTLGFHRHEAVGARLFVGIAARLGMSAERAERIAFVIEHHGRTNQFDPSWTDAALRRLVRECGPHLPLMLAFSAIDWTTRRASRAARIRDNLALLEARLAALDAEPADTPRTALPPGLAEHLIAESGRPPGPWVGEALHVIAHAIDKGHVTGTGVDALTAWWLAGPPDDVVGNPDER